jgi:transposase
VVTDGGGIPLADLATPANAPDAAVLAEMADRIEPIKRPRGRPRQRPDKLHTDKAYDHAKHRQTLRDRGITPRIARKGIDATQHLGRHRWVVERTLAWLSRYRRLRVRDERRDDIHQAFLDLGCALVCWHLLQ